MSEDEHLPPDAEDGASDGQDDEGSPEAGDIPASVTFMEMMRQAAARREPPPSVWADPGHPPRAVTRRLRPRFEDADEPAPEPPDEVPDMPDAGPKPAPPRRVSAGRDGPPSYEQAMQNQKTQRSERRKMRRYNRTVGVVGGIVRSSIIVMVAAVLVATIFTWSTPSGFLQRDVRQELSLAIATAAVTAQPTALPTPNWLRRIGVVAGHRGPENDPGAVCADGMTEAEINFNVAQLVVRTLRGRGYTVDLLDEFDPRLNGYQAAALLSIHANTCQEWPGGEVVSGFNIAAPAARITARGNDELLVNCVARHYTTASGLQRREGVTVDMTDYHTFREIHSFTPAAIIELGFLLADRDVLANQPDQLARGLVDGILCYLEPGAPAGEPASA